MITSLLKLILTISILLHTAHSKKLCVDHVDIGTSEESKSTVSAVTLKEMKLVYSDEFYGDRNFTKGEDNVWELDELWDWESGDQSIYTKENANAADGFLILSVYESYQCWTAPNGSNKCSDFNGGRITSWNNLCFTGGRIEISAKMATMEEMPGYSPRFALMGNLARVGYPASMQGIYPYSYNECDEGVFPTNSTGTGGETWKPGKSAQELLMEEVRETRAQAACEGPCKFDKPYDIPAWGGATEPFNTGSCLPGQRINACNAGKYPSSGFGMRNGEGRGAPVIEILGNVNSKEKQLLTGEYVFAPKAPFPYGPTDNPYYGPNTGRNLEKGVRLRYVNNTLVSDNIGWEKSLTQNFFQEFHDYGVEWEPGEYIVWLMDGKPVFMLTQDDLVAQKVTEGEDYFGYPVEVSKRLISEEPMYVILGLSVNGRYSPVDRAVSIYPQVFLIDYVRLYQYPDKVDMSCDAKKKPSRDYIRAHWDYYHDASNCCFEHRCMSCQLNSTMPNTCYEHSQSPKMPPPHVFNTSPPWPKLSCQEGEMINDMVIVLLAVLLGIWVFVY
eukprot:Nk52_evm3s462 gene=Nk52_evmTU3s462